MSKDRNDRLRMWTVYDHPADMPDHFVARLWVLEREGAAPTTLALVSKDLEPLRDILRELGFHAIPRTPGDDPVIVEVWM